MNLPIPAENAPANTANDLSKLEMADLSAPKKVTILYENQIADLRAEVLRLREDNRRIEGPLAECRAQIATQASSLASLERQNVEMWVGSGLAACFLALGGGLISTYPINSDLVPWQFAVGWCCLVAGILTSVVTPALVAGVHGVRSRFRAPK